MLPDVSPTLIQDHWRGVLRHLHGHGFHSTAVSTQNFSAFTWQHGRRGVCLLLPRSGASLGPCEDFLRAMPAPEKLIEVPACDPREQEFFERGWKTAYELPVHVIPSDPEWSKRLEPFPEGFTPEEVRTERHVADFAFVQDEAYRDRYDYPRGCSSQFFTHPAALIGSNVVSAVIYDDASGLPVRAGSLVRAEGLVSGVSGASCGTGRGAGCFRLLWSFLLGAARERFASDFVLHETMPVALHLADKMHLEEVARFTRWTRYQ